MNFRSFFFLLLCPAAFAADLDRPTLSMRVHGALAALAKADSIKVTGELKRKDAEGGISTVPISKEIRSHESIAKLSSLLASHRWELIFKDQYTVDRDAAFLRLISFEKGRKADEFRLIGRSHLEHPWMGIFRNDSESLNAKAVNLILTTE